MNITDTRAITSVIVNRTSSLREPNRPIPKDDVASSDNGTLVMNKRSLSSDKMSSDSMVPVFVSQRGSSLRQNGKSAFPISSPNANNHHAFKIIKPIETSPIASESSLDHESIATVKQRLKFKHRNQIPSPGGPLIPDHNLMKEPPTDNVYFTPRPPLVKRFSYDQEETNSDIDTNQSTKNSRSYQVLQQSTAPRPPISPTRGMGQSLKSSNNTAITNTERNEKVGDNAEEDTSEIEDIPNSDCETPSLANYATEEPSIGTKHRSSLRKGSDSPSQSDVPGRASPSPTKSVKWNLNTEVKKIPRSRSLNGKFKSSKTKSSRTGSDRIRQMSSNDQKLVESHGAYIGHCTTIIRHQMSLIESIRNDRISISRYKRDLADFLECQNKLVTNLQNMLLTDVENEQDKIDYYPDKNP